MTQHYPENVQAVLSWCDTCRKMTLHRTDFKRMGSCTEHKAEGLSKKQEKSRAEREEEGKQPKLF